MVLKWHCFPSHSKNVGRLGWSASLRLQSSVSGGATLHLGLSSTLKGGRHGWMESRKMHMPTSGLQRSGHDGNVKQKPNTFDGAVRVRSKSVLSLYCLHKQLFLLARGPIIFNNVRYWQTHACYFQVFR